MLARLNATDEIGKIPRAHNELCEAIERFGADAAREQIKVEALKRRLIAFERRARVWQIVYGVALGAVGSALLGLAAR